MKSWGGLLFLTAALAACADEAIDEAPEVAAIAGDLNLRDAEVVEGRIYLDEEVAFETVSLGAAGAATRDDDGSIALQRGLIIERIRDHEAGVEQTWEIPAPSGGDLVFRVAAHGLTFVSSDEAGLHFVDQNGLATRYGHGTLIDSAGRTTAVPSVWDGGEIVLTIPASVANTASYPIVLDPVIGTENGSDAAILGPAEGQQYTPRLAVAGTTALAIWSDQREHGYYYEPYGTRLNSSGAVQDTYGVSLNPCTGFESCYDFEIASDGSGYLLVYRKYTGFTGSDVFGQRYTSALVPVGSQFVISQAPSDQFEMDVTYNGTNYIVVWRDTRGANPAIYGARVNTSGTVLDSVDTGVLLSTTATANGEAAAVHCLGATCLVAWSDARSGASTRDIYAQRWNGNTGALIGGELALSTAANDQQVPDITGIVDFLVVWSDNRSTGGDTDIYGTRVTTGGSVSDPSGLAIATGGGWQEQPKAANNGSEYRVAWTYGGTPYTTRVTTAGAILDGASGVAVNTTFAYWYLEDMVWNGSLYLMLGTSYQKKTQGDVVMAAYSGTAITSPTMVTTAANGQTHPAVASNGSTYLYAWADWRDGDLSIRVAQANATGVITSSTEIIRQTDTTGTQPYLNPYVDVAWNGTQYLVVWTDQYGYASPTPLRGVWGQRVTSAGALSGAPFGIATNTLNTEHYERPSVASDGASWYVVWQRWDGMGEYDIWGTRVPASGPIPAAVQISAGTGSRTQPSVAFGGGTYLVVWADYRSDPSGDIYGARVNTSGSVVDAAGFAIEGTAGAYTYTPEVASTGTNFLVAWQGGPSSYRRVSTTGTMLDAAPLPIDPFGGVAYNPDVAADPAGVYLVTFQNGNLDLYGQRVNASDGAAMSTSTFLIQSVIGNVDASSVVGGPSGAFAAVYSRFDDGATVKAARLKSRILTRLVNGTACTFGLDCTSGNCVDGVCCNSACGSGSSTDCQSCNIAGSVGTCSNLPSTTTCRAAAGACDQAETCTGTSSTCPADGKRPTSYMCDAATAGTCETDAYCDGMSNTCPANGPAAMGFVCRAVAGGCDLEEVCNGTSTACPSDTRRPMGYVCDPAVAGTCENDSTCNGSSATCPANPARPMGFVCRAAAGICDLQETCNGTSTSCPMDAKRSTAYLCDAATALCEEDAYCDGMGDACPANALSPPTDVCRAAAGMCDVAENCTGLSAACPMDGFQPATVVCRPAASDCDIAENCTGMAAACPPTDTLQPDTTPCNDGDNCTVGDNCLAGTCTPTGPALVASPSPLDFGAVVAGDSSEMTVTVTNFAAAPHNITSSDIDEAAFSTDFTSAAVTGFGTALVDVTFAPTAATAYDGQLTLTVASCPDVVVELTGAGQLAGVSVEPTSHDFGDVGVGAGETQEFVVENTGDTSFDVETIAVDATASFTVNVLGDQLPRRLNPGDTLTFEVVAHPMALGPFSGSVEIATDIPPAPGQKVAVPVQVNGIEWDGDGGLPPDAGPRPDASNALDSTSVYACTTSPGTPAGLPALLLLGAVFVLIRRRG